MHHFKLSAYNRSIQEIRDKKQIQKNLKKNMHHFKLSAYNIV